MVNTVERGHQIKTGGPKRQLLRSRPQRHNPRTATVITSHNLCQHGRRHITGEHHRTPRQQPTQQPRIPPRPTPDVKTDNRPVRQQPADPAHRHLIGRPQRLVLDRHLLEVLIHGHPHTSHTRPVDVTFSSHKDRILVQIRRQRALAVALPRRSCSCGARVRPDMYWFRRHHNCKIDEGVATPRHRLRPACSCARWRAECLPVDDHHPLPPRSHSVHQR